MFGFKYPRYKPIVEEALTIAKAPASTKVIVFQRTDVLEAELISGRDIHWQDSILSAPAHDCVDVDANSPLYVLHTSGTTGTTSNWFW